MKKRLALLGLVMTLGLTLSACGGKDTAEKGGNKADMVYAVEAGSAGEAAAA